MRDLFACLRARVCDNPRSTLRGLVLAALLVLLALGAATIEALAAWVRAESEALGALLGALDSGWTKLAGSGAVLWLLAAKDRKA